MPRISLSCNSARTIHRHSASGFDVFHLRARLRWRLTVVVGTGQLAVHYVTTTAPCAAGYRVTGRCFKPKCFKRTPTKSIEVCTIHSRASAFGVIQPRHPLRERLLTGSRLDVSSQTVLYKVTQRCMGIGHILGYVYAWCAFLF